VKHSLNIVFLLYVKGKAFKLKAIDMVYIDFKDLNGLKSQSEQGYRMGFSGKQVIHPAQVDIVQEAFKPSTDKIKWAAGLVSEILDSKVTI
jgi:citrate lyase subunit beta-like protein